MSRFYDWNATLSRQTDTRGEISVVIGAKGAGRAFALRKMQDYAHCAAKQAERQYRACDFNAEG